MPIKVFQQNSKLCKFKGIWISFIIFFEDKSNKVANNQESEPSEEAKLTEKSEQLRLLDQTENCEKLIKPWLWDEDYKKLNLERVKHRDLVIMQLLEEKKQRENSLKNKEKTSMQG